jgi:hypothetical protein
MKTVVLSIVVVALGAVVGAAGAGVTSFYEI